MLRCDNSVFIFGLIGLLYTQSTVTLTRFVVTAFSAPGTRACSNRQETHMITISKSLVFALTIAAASSASLVAAPADHPDR